MDGARGPDFLPQGLKPVIFLGDAYGTAKAVP
jgi:hypothetical protein